MTMTIYHNPRCSKSRQTLALLQEKNVPFEIVEYLVTPPSEAELKRILKKLGLSAKDIVRRKEAKEANVDLDQGEDALIADIVKHPIVIERPIVVDGKRAVLGRPPEKVLGLF